jgi:dual specificity tyrosine-phosphorylation-regulated kinase 2/3/4
MSVSPIKSHNKVFRRTSADFSGIIPTLRLPNSPRHRLQTISKAETRRPITSRTILKPIPVASVYDSGCLLPATADDVILHLKDQLSEFEQIEILDYAKVYYIGKKQKIRGKIADRNWGFDSAKRDYIVIISDHLDYRYEILEIIGKGTFGQVVRCFDHQLKEIVAVKILKSKQKQARQGAVEIKVLKTLNEIPNETIVRLKNHFIFRSHLCMVFELLSLNLYEFSKKNLFRQFHFSILQNFSQQILKALKLVHDKNIIHCDLKPENILLVNERSGHLKIIDFGSSCFATEKVYSYIQSRFYRAPEVILGIPYTSSIDLWSFGCILAELALGYPLFPGDSESDLLLKIVEVLGLPPNSFLSQVKRKKVLFEDDRLRVREKFRSAQKKPLSDVIGRLDLLFVEFIAGLLVWEPKARLTADQALAHPWLSKNYARRAAKESFLKTEILANKTKL